jgi:hypothetical protein
VDDTHGRGVGGSSKSGEPGGAPAAEADKMEPGGVEELGGGGPFLGQFVTRMRGRGERGARMASSSVAAHTTDKGEGGGVGVGGMPPEFVVGRRDVGYRQQHGRRGGGSRQQWPIAQEWEREEGSRGVVVGG